MGLDHGSDLRLDHESDHGPDHRSDLGSWIRSCKIKLEFLRDKSK